MWTAKWILDAYEKGTEPERWEMYMTYRELRTCFDEMEGGRGVSRDGKKALPVGKNHGTWFSPRVKLVKG